MQRRFSFPEAHRALELLEEYHSKLTGLEDRPLREAIERVIMIFKGRLFKALLGKSGSSFSFCVNWGPRRGIGSECSDAATSGPSCDFRLF